MKLSFDRLGRAGDPLPPSSPEGTRMRTSGQTGQHAGLPTPRPRADAPTRSPTRPRTKRREHASKPRRLSEPSPKLGLSEPEP